MPAKKTSSSKALRQLLAEAGLSTRLGYQLLDADMFAPVGKSLDQVMNFDLDLIYAASARVAFRLDKGDKGHAAMLKVFQTAGLDHQNPYHWRVLLRVFSEFHFGRKTTKPVQWDVFALCDVLRDYVKVKKSHPLVKTDSERCRLLQKNEPHRTKYGHYNPDAFRKLVRKALNPKHNLFLRRGAIENPLLQEYRERHESKGETWTPTVEANMKRLIDKVLEIIDASSPISAR